MELPEEPFTLYSVGPRFKGFKLKVSLSLSSSVVGKVEIGDKISFRNLSSASD